MLPPSPHLHLHVYALSLLTSSCLLLSQFTHLHIYILSPFTPSELYPLLTDTLFTTSPYLSCLHLLPTYTLSHSHPLPIHSSTIPLSPSYLHQNNFTLSYLFVVCYTTMFTLPHFIFIPFYLYPLQSYSYQNIYTLSSHIHTSIFTHSPNIFIPAYLHPLLPYLYHHIYTHSQHIHTMVSTPAPFIFML